MLKNQLQKIAKEANAKSEKLTYEKELKELEQLVKDSAKMGGLGMRIRIQDLSDEYIPEDLKDIIKTWAKVEGLDISFDGNWIQLFWL